MSLPSLSVMLALGSALLAIVAGLVILRTGMRTALLDQPGHRRSHHVATPRGGGWGIALVIVAVPLLLAWWDLLSLRLALSLGISGLIIALCGAWDDRAQLGAAGKLLLQGLATVVFLLGVSGVPELQLAAPLAWGWPGYLFAGLGLLWMTNLFNFMDGMDGLAGTQGVLCLGVMAALMACAGANGVMLLALSASAACAGFLLLNWPPARLFMGDVSSLTLGWSLASLALVSTSSGISWVPYIILFGLFFFDATITLVNRLIGGRRWYTAHREHAYQALLRSGLSHRQVLHRAIGLNVLLYVPLALLAWWQPVWQWPLFAVAGVASWLIWWACRRHFVQCLRRQR